MARHMIHHDFEYNDRQVVCGCFLDSQGKTRTTIDFRTPRGADQLRRYIQARPEHVWVSYAAQAELESMLRVGITPAEIKPMVWLDLMVECHMITGTHRAFHLHRPSLLGHLDLFVRPQDPGARARKDAMRDLILSRETWSDEEFDAIIDYCWSDVVDMPALLATVRRVHQAVKSPWKPADAYHRGEFLKASAVAQFRSQGLPIDVPMKDRFRQHRAAVRNLLAERGNAHYGVEIWQRKAETISRDPETQMEVRRISYGLSFKGLEEHVRQQPYAENWERTQSGRLKTDSDYLDDICKEFPSLREFKGLRDAMAQLKDDKLLAREKDGFIQPYSSPFWTVTSRSQPWVNKGFLLNAPPWMRSILRPPPGYAVVAVDWAKQEIGIAAALSGDAVLRDAYLGDDLYFELAKMAKAVPADATREDAKGKYGLIRQAYKSVQLGLGFGMGRRGLTRKLFADLNAGLDEVAISRRDAEVKANEVYDWHKATFVKYWSFLHEQAERAQAVGWTVSADRWLYFADADTPKPKLLNFPMQANGAAMMREAVKIIAWETDLDLICTLHDALYFYCRVEDIEATKRLAQDAMRRAVQAIIGDTIEIGTDTNVYTYEKPMRDARGLKTLEMVERMIAEIETNPHDPTIEVVPAKPARAPKQPPPTPQVVTGSRNPYADPDAGRPPRRGVIWLDPTDAGWTEGPPPVRRDD